MPISALHRIVGPDSNNPLVVRGPKGEPVTLDGLPFEEAQRWHRRLRELGEPHRWQAYAGPRTGWNSVSAFVPQETPA